MFYFGIASANMKTVQLMNRSMTLLSTDGSPFLLVLNCDYVSLRLLMVMVSGMTSLCLLVNDSSMSTVTNIRLVNVISEGPGVWCRVVVSFLEELLVLSCLSLFVALVHVVPLWESGLVKFAEVVLDTVRVVVMGLLIGTNTYRNMHVTMLVLNVRVVVVNVSCISYMGVFRRRSMLWYMLMRMCLPCGCTNGRPGVVDGGRVWWVRYRA